jgi:Rps23 Pro-64 3,4-dihydroxylase Tpa1-like proline 4-hydroxylase
METNKHDQPVRMYSRLDEGLVARVFRAAGRVHIPDFLDVASATRIHRALAVETPWRSVLFDGREHRELDVASLAELPACVRKAIVARVEAAASRGFSYRYASFRLYENWQRGLHRDAWLMRVLEFLNSPPFLELMRRVTGDSLIGYADAQATKFGPGDFLTRHDDRIDGKDRRAAYVLSMTPDWETDWGGLLAFPDARGHLSEAYSPAFNALNLFRVPMLHAVTQVSSFAVAPRYSITGWLRRQPASA